MYMVMKNFSLLRGVRNCRKLNHSVITTKFVSPTHPLDRNKKFLVCHICSICNRSASSVVLFRAFYQSAQFINWPAQSRNYRLGAQFINRVRNLEIESRASNERSVHVLFIA